MSLLYAESSAVLAWLLGDEGAETARSALSSAEAVFTSELTLVECSRALIRAHRVEGLPESSLVDRRNRLLRAAAHWTILELGREVTDRARDPFPSEPLRTLDALHLASALVARAALDELAVLSLDRRIRDNAIGLGLDVVPDAQPTGATP
jgi:predicted nucleic acid-binding protein